ncbi:MAG TPA: uroporphyrinogen-III synthase [Allosphingosinicella sp.]
MTGLVLVLRPEPGASETAARARRLGLEPVAAPLFAVRALAWEPPDPADFDAILLTSANGARHAGPGLAAFRHLPCVAVGEATAAAAMQAGFPDVRTGPGDAGAALATIGDRRVLHLCGREHLPLDHARLARRIVYASDAVGELPETARAALGGGALALIHSPRAGALFALLADAAGLARPAIALAAISEAAATAAGRGWRSLAAAARPRDEALLELAAELCKKAREAD